MDTSSPQPPPSSTLRASLPPIRVSITFKLFVIALLVGCLLLLSIPLFNIINEREERREDVVREISAKWGMDQAVIGPILVVPFERTVITKNNLGESISRTETDYLHFLPEVLDINASVGTETRHRGIFESVVYETDVRLEGRFASIDWSATGIHEDLILTDKASLVIGIPDTRGLRDPISINFGQEDLTPFPGLPAQKVVNSGIMATVDLTDSNETLPFSITLRLAGSSSLAFSPIGQVTTAQVSSDWPNPSFDGAFLPQAEISEQGFSANWKVLHLNRPIPRSWVGDAPASNEHDHRAHPQLHKHNPEHAPGFAAPNNALGDAAFGLRFHLPTDVYQKTERMAKYAILFLAFAFAAFFFSEIVRKLRVHPIQYLFVGFSILVFYLLLLSLSEHVGFDAAYGLSTAGIVILVGGYAKTILESARLGATVASVLIILYGYLYVTLQLESYALLMGSLGLFGALAAAMYLTRHIDWYAIRAHTANSSDDS